MANKNTLKPGPKHTIFALTKFVSKLKINGNWIDLEAL